MTERQFLIKANEVVKQIIDCIANKEYSKLHTFMNIDNSWCKDCETQIEGIERFGEWLNEQLEIWAEEYEKEYIIDPFNGKFLLIDSFRGDCAFATYNPKSNGDELDLWFEIKFKFDKYCKIITEFNVNI